MANERSPLCLSFCWPRNGLISKKYRKVLQFSNIVDLYEIANKDLMYETLKEKVLHLRHTH